MMVYIRNGLLILLAALVVTEASRAATPLQGGFGLPHVRAAWVLDKGYLSAATDMRFWGKTAPQQYALFTKSGERSLWDLQNVFMLNLGIGAHSEVELLPVIYQSDQSHAGLWLHDLQVGITTASWPWPMPALQWGGRFVVTIPTGERHNLLFEEYSVNAFAFSCSALMSYAFDTSFPRDAASLHLNAGYHIYNDVGEMLTDRFEDPYSHVLKRSQWLAYGAGVLLPGERFDGGVECHGVHWLQPPPPAAEGREAYLYAGLFLGYKPLRWLQFRIGGEKRLSGDHDATIPSLQARGLGEFPNYHAWRVQLGLRMQVLPLHLLRSTSRDPFIRRADERQELFKQIIDDGSRAPASSSELERIRSERARAEKELERLQKILEKRKETEKRAQAQQP